MSEPNALIVVQSEAERRLILEALDQVRKGLSEPRVDPDHPNWIVIVPVPDTAGE